jgi:hypothetical protein
MRIANEPNELLGTFTMISVYSKPEPNLLKESSGTLRVIDYAGSKGLCIIEAKSITSVVALIPFILADHEKNDPNIYAQYSESFLVGEKPFLDFTTTTTDPSWQAVEETATLAE